MRGHADFEEFVAARAQDLHHDAYLLMASQHHAEELVTVVLAELFHEHLDLTQAAATARIRMAQKAARIDSSPPELNELPTRFRTLAALTSRQRAILLLEFVDGHEPSSTARALGLKPHDVVQASAALPPELTGAAELRSLLDDFGDLVETPPPATTLAAIHTAHLARRPWWAYAITALVVALTVSSLWVTQAWHNDWLRTAAGLNHTHGTHFPAYSDGYKLVGIRDVTTHLRHELALGMTSALAFQCTGGQPNGAAVAQVVTGSNGNYTARCGAAGQARLMPTTGGTLLTVTDSRDAQRPVGIYRKVPWSEYPVATSGFRVQTASTLQLESPMRPSAPLTRGPVLTLRGTPGHLNGTFTGSVAVPAGARRTLIGANGLLSPTTTGRFQVAINGEPWSPYCDLPSRAPYYLGRADPWCEIYDKNVPQVSFGTTPYGEVGKTITVSITVQHALGPWTLQVVAGRFPVVDPSQ